MADNIRRAQLVAPFGVGALSVLKNGSAVLTAGLDAWFHEEHAEREEFEVMDLRLTASLGVRNLYLPPDYRAPWEVYGPGERRNLGLTVPFLLLPRWHVCPKCRRMHELSLHQDVTGRGVPCPHHEDVKPAWRRPRLQQVRFLVMCVDGHVQDFPWLEWAHRSLTPTCNGPLLLRVTTGASLSAIWVSCESCDTSPRNLAGIMHADSNDETALSKDLETGQRFTCRGYRPWLGENAVGCGADLRATLRSATNVHFGRVRSAIFLPPEATPAVSSERLVKGIEHEMNTNPDFRAVYDTLRQAGIAMPTRVGQVRDFLKAQGESGWNDDQIVEAIRQVDLALAGTQITTTSSSSGSWSETSFRREEFEVLRTNVNADELLIRTVPAERYGTIAEGRAFSDFFERVGLVTKLRETRAYFGFSRVRPDEHVPVPDARRMLSRNPLPWLPAAVVRGEGVFLEFKESALQTWEKTVNASKHLNPIRDAFERLHQDHRVGPDIDLTPRLVMLHTLAHVLMNRLVFDCGYGSASLRERLYVSAQADTRMAGLLIYTAAGDSEGTMGGLVEMGLPGKLEPVMRRALEAAAWCSLDPVCMEVGERQGQGPDSCNLAACHSCALIPETSCEQFNRFLDRATLIGTLNQHTIGFFG